MSVLQFRLFKQMNELSNILQDGKTLKDTVGRMCKKYSKHLDESSGGPTIGKSNY